MKPPQEIKKPLVKKTTRIILEKKVREQKSELKIRGGQLRQGADREKVAQEQIHIRTKAMESTSDGIFIIDAREPDFMVIYTNPAFRRQTGFTNNEIIGKNYFLLYGPDADVRLVEEMKGTMRQGQSFHGEMLNFRKNGKKFWSSLRIAPVRDAKGVSTHYVGIQTDITLMKQRDLEIEEQREELLHVTRVGKMAEFVSSLAHEISQPLTAILSYSQAAQRLLAGPENAGAGREPQLQEILQYIINDDLRASEVIKRLRVLLKKTKPSFELLNINVLIHDTVKLIMTHIIVRNKIVKFELDPKLPFVQGDRIQLQQVLLNLISNSLEAMDDSPASRELWIKTSFKDNDMILVKVQDSGSGISAPNMKKLFTHFFTTKTNGLGMGLPICRSIVEAHGGRLDAENNTGRGATFYFSLPIKGKDGL